MRNICIITVIILLIHSCGPATTKETKVSDESIKIVLSEYHPTLVDTVFFRGCKILPLETNAESILSGIDRVCIDGNTVFILDKNVKSVFIFDINGRHIHTVHDVGLPC